MEPPIKKEELTFHERIRKATSGPEAADRMVAFLYKIGQIKELTGTPEEVARIQRMADSLWDEEKRRANEYPIETLPQRIRESLPEAKADWLIAYYVAVGHIKEAWLTPEEIPRVRRFSKEFEEEKR